ncbi:MAG: HAMP domain-containing sensor histidine kinase [Verrucomicrobiota bacterium]
MRPALRWFLFIACLAVFGAAMTWMSLRMLDLEEQRKTTAKDAQVQEKVRLALWRMDSLASALLIRENSRPAWHYQAFYAPDDLFASSTQSIPKGEALMPSPLFGTVPDMVNLHFELVSGIACSPQAPAGSQKDLAMNWYAASPQMNVATGNLQKLDALIKRHPEVQKLPSLSDTRIIERKPAPAARQEEAPKTTAAVNDDATKSDIQTMNNVIEQAQRAQVFNKNFVSEKEENLKAPLKKESKIAPPAKPGGKMASASASASAPMPAAAPAAVTASPSVGADAAMAAAPGPADAPGTSSSLDAVTRRYRGNRETAAVPGAQPAEILAEAPAPAQRQSLPALAGDLRPVWVENELLLVRQAVLEGQPRLQGVWLNWSQLQASLMDSIRDLLPEAKLLTIAPEAAKTDATALVTLPVKLLTGRVPVTLPIEISTFRSALHIAWGCLIAAALAIAYVLHRAMQLSERRGAFVSAVTHELRTPLTTFRLYSEMLADDMVPEPQQRKEYLNTLCDESTRLMHLVENVLSYSRIERGRTAARLETVRIGDILQRIEPRLRQRADMCGLTIKLEVDAAAAPAQAHVDAMAVEQILFNLTDNACKYAAPDSDPHELHLRVEAEGKHILILFRDFGPGLSKQALKKLFQPFAKSATEAAHSAPGVGLGLALCRRLADELGGKLEHRRCDGRGACFCLTLPRS